MYSFVVRLTGSVAFGRCVVAHSPLLVSDRIDPRGTLFMENMIDILKWAFSTDDLVFRISFLSTS